MHAARNILSVEDSIADADLIEHFASQSMSCELASVRDGEEALDYLEKRGSYEDVATPSLVLLDLNLPKVDGREVLKRIKTSPALKSIPVVVLTTSDAKTDIRLCYELGANCYFCKPMDVLEYQNIFEAIEATWFKVGKTASA